VHLSGGRPFGRSGECPLLVVRLSANRSGLLPDLSQGGNVDRGERGPFHSIFRDISRRLRASVSWTPRGDFLLSFVPVIGNT
jgi:hypothetical protein